MNANNLSENEIIQNIQKTYREFSEKISAIEAERDKKLSKIAAGIDKRKIDQLLQKIKDN